MMTCVKIDVFGLSVKLQLALSLFIRIDRLCLASLSSLRFILGWILSFVDLLYYKL